MKTYDETISAVFAKGDAIIEQRRQKAAKIKQTSYAVSGVCAAAAVALGIWRMSDLKDLPDNHFSEIETVEEKTTDTTTSEPAATTADTETAQKTTSSGKSAVTSAVTTTFAASHTDEIHHTTKNITAPIIKTTVSVAYQTTRKTTQSQNITSETTNTITTTQTASNTSVLTSDVSTTVITTTNMNSLVPNTELTSIFDTIELSEEESVASDKKIQNFRYSIDNIDEGEIGSLIKKHCLHGLYYDGEKNIEIENIAEFYEINGYSPNIMIAVKFEGSSEYKRYINTLYSPQSLEEVISDFKLSEDNFPDHIIYNRNSIDNINTEKLWEMVTENAYSANQTDHPKDKDDYLITDKLCFFLYKMTGTIEIYPQGYIYVSISPINNLCFYIGDEKAKEIIDYFVK